MKVTIINDKNQKPKTTNNANIRCWGMWGRVLKQNNDNTVDVRLDLGVVIRYVPVACKNWFILDVDSNKDFNAGERDIPPLNARVFIFMPSFTFNDCFVAPFSGIYTKNKDIAKPFIEEDRQKIRECIKPNGWHITDDYVTGSYKAISPDKKTSLLIDYGDEENPKTEKQELHLDIFNNVQADITAEEKAHLSIFNEITIDHEKEKKCTVKIFDTELVIEKGKVSIKPKETTIEVDGRLTVNASGDATVNTDGNAEIKAGGNVKVEADGNADMKGTNVTVDASTLLTLKTGDAATLCPNIVPQCPLGIPHGGKPAGILKLVGA